MSFLQSFLNVIQKDLTNRAQEVSAAIVNGALNATADNVKGAACHHSGIVTAIGIVNSAAQWLASNPESTSFPESFLTEAAQAMEAVANPNPTPVDPTAPIDPNNPITITAESSVQN
jgi:hypothetical protein